MTGLETLRERYHDESEYHGVDKMLECFFDILDEGAYIEIEGRGGFKKINGKIEYFAPDEGPDYVPMKQEESGLFGKSFRDIQLEAISKTNEEDENAIQCHCGRTIRIIVEG